MVAGGLDPGSQGGGEASPEAELTEASRGRSAAVFMGLEDCTTSWTELPGGVAIQRERLITNPPVVRPE